MQNVRIPLEFTPKIDAISIPELCGYAEMAAVSRSTSSTVELLNRMLQKKEKPDNITAETLVTADRDRILAAIYISVFGSRLQSTVRCISCDGPFDIEFDLEKLQTWIQEEKKENFFSMQAEGMYLTPDGKKFRLPTGDDEMAVADLNAEAAEEVLFRRCTGNQLSISEKEFIQQSMEKIASLLSAEMNVVCPECRIEQEVSFDMQSFFMDRLVGERRLLFSEIHSLAKNYHWGIKEILDLPRSLRKDLVAAVNREF